MHHFSLMHIFMHDIHNGNGKSPHLSWNNRCICSISGRYLFVFMNFHLFHIIHRVIHRKPGENPRFPVFSWADCGKPCKPAKLSTVIFVDNFGFIHIFIPQLSPAKSENKIRFLSYFCNSQYLDSMKIQKNFWSFFVRFTTKFILPSPGSYVIIMSSTVKSFPYFRQQEAFR